MCRNPSVAQLTQKTVRPDDYRNVTRRGQAAGRVIRVSRQVAGLLIVTEIGQSEPAWTTENAANDHDPFAAGVKMPGIVTLNEPSRP
jgi:hypothetical protein